MHGRYNIKVLDKQNTQYILPRIGSRACTGVPYAFLMTISFPYCNVRALNVCLVVASNNPVVLSCSKASVVIIQ